MPQRAGTPAHEVFRTQTADALIDAMGSMTSVPGMADKKRAIQEMMTAKIKVVAAHDLLEVMQSATLESTNVDKVVLCLDNIAEQPEAFDEVAPSWLLVALQRMLKEDR